MRDAHMTMEESALARVIRWASAFAFVVGTVAATNDDAHPHARAHGGERGTRQVDRGPGVATAEGYAEVRDPEVEGA